MARVIYSYDFKFCNPADAEAREFVLHDHFTSGKDGPRIVFKKRAQKSGNSWVDSLSA
jgi:hypothetical protein